jgi:hypothetical protein
MTKEQLITRWQKKLDDTEAEIRRQLPYLGVRLGVMLRIRELERERRKIAKRLIELQPEREPELNWLTW